MPKADVQPEPPFRGAAYSTSAVVSLTQCIDRLAKRVSAFGKSPGNFRPTDFRQRTLATAFVVLLVLAVALHLLTAAPAMQSPQPVDSRQVRSRGHLWMNRFRQRRLAKAAAAAGADAAIEPKVLGPSASLLGNSCDACGLLCSRGVEVSAASSLPTVMPNGLNEALGNDSLHQRTYRFMCSLRTACAATGDLWAIVVVTSAASNFERRAAIRETWARDAEASGMKVVFLVGLRPELSVLRALADESVQRGDLIVGDFPDSYDLLTVKSVAMLRWATLECPLASYLAKVDDDMYVSLPRLLIVLRRWVANARVVLGVTHSGRSVITNPQHKWYNPFYEKHYGSTDYPLYTSGPTYVVAMPLARELYNASQSEPFDRMEDVFVTGICARRVGNVTFVRSRGFSGVKRSLSSFRSQQVVTGHRVKPWEMRTIWSMLHEINAVQQHTGVPDAAVAVAAPQATGIDLGDAQR